MCNYKHNDSIVPRKKRGIGYKLFTRNEKGELVTLCWGDKYRTHENGWAYWTEITLGGFCVMPSLKVARKAMIDWNRGVICSAPVLCKVHYDEAIWKHNERDFMGNSRPVPMILVKKFDYNNLEVIEELETWPGRRHFEKK